MDVICPGFSADCLETIEEIGIENRDAFLEAGGEQFHYIPALNDRADHIHSLAALVQKHLAGWPEAAPDWNAAQHEAENRQRLARARALGAES